VSLVFRDMSETTYLRNHGSDISTQRLSPRPRVSAFRFYFHITDPHIHHPDVLDFR
jgi:hypothetical protein